MKTKLWIGLAIAAVIGIGGVIQSTPAAENKCDYCDLKIIPDTKTQDNVTRMSVKGKRYQYRCVLCAIGEAKEDFPKENVTIYAPSEKKGKPVVIKMSGGKWSASPKSAVYLKAPVKHRQCHLGYRAFSSKAALAAWAKKNDWPNKPLSLSQMVTEAK